MKPKKTRQRTEAPAKTQTAFVLKWWHIVLGAAGVVLAAFILYGPSLNGPFVFDDRYLPFMTPSLAKLPLKAWMGVRPLLNFSYWITYQISGLDSFPYHALNVVLHALNSMLVFLIVRKFLSMAGETGGKRNVLAGLAGVVFLAHPVMTESVAYVASRSETLSVFFAFSAFAVYMYTREHGLRPGHVVLVLLLFVAALTTKEHTLALPAVFIVTDLFWSGFAGVRRNRLFYGVILLGLAIGAAVVWNVLKSTKMIGFSAENLTWYQYLFTQFRAVCIYLRLFLLPVGLNVDYDMPPSLTIVQHLAILWLAVLLGLGFLAWKYRREYPMAAYGFLIFLILLAPTSSIVPIRDVIAERRVYLPSIGLLLIGVDLLRHLRWSTARYAALAAGLFVVLGAATYVRAQVWSDNVLLWQDSVSKSPNKVRPRLQLGYFEMESGNCNAAVADYEAASRLEKPTYDLLVNWAYALDCAGRTDEALAKLREAEKIEHKAHLYATMGMMLGKQKRNSEALDALNKAAAVNPRFAMTYLYRGNVYMQSGEPARALEDYRQAVKLDPSIEAAQQALAMAERRFEQAGR